MIHCYDRGKPVSYHVYYDRAAAGQAELDIFNESIDDCIESLKDDMDELE